ncbi:hypothetical protein HHI36_007655 [Cryptolaemus montrouzieri]|uniref:RING-type domain-containing protein n=1 Tax=Cryptolaemus montrouzieri TaxID=559131 RepID=A0ABD2MQD1_9CUCU
MANWVYCNKCFQQPQKARNIKFFLTECGHITCEKCAAHIKVSNSCFVCKKTPTGLMQLSKEMDPSIQSFFGSVETQIKKTMEIYQFQNKQKEFTFNMLRDKYNYAKQQCMQQYSNNIKLIQENKILRSMLKNSGERERPISSTPLRVNNSFLPNVSVSTISPNRGFPPNRMNFSQFTPINGFPGMAHRLSTSNPSNQE